MTTCSAVVCYPLFFGEELGFDGADVVGEVYGDALCGGVGGCGAYDRPYPEYLVANSVACFEYGVVGYRCVVECGVDFSCHLFGAEYEVRVYVAFYRDQVFLYFCQEARWELVGAG